MITPKNIIGYTPGRDFLSSDRYSLRYATITRVDPINMKADLHVVTGDSERFEVDLTQGMCGPRSFFGGVPEVNSLCVIGYRRIHKNLVDAVILGYIPTGNKSGLRFDPFSAYDPADIVGEDPELVQDIAGTIQRYKRLLLSPGDVGGMSSSGAEFVLSRDVSFVNRAGDSLELRDSDRTLVQQAVHSVVSVGGVKSVSGPIRRGGGWLPPDVVNGRNLVEGYAGTTELQSAGPGLYNTDDKWAKDGTLHYSFNDEKEFPPVVLPSGKHVYYPLTTPGGSLTDPDSSGDAFVEVRQEVYHTSDLGLDVLEEIDGFNASRRVPFIEHVLGTVVGSDLTSTGGQRTYGRILKPKLFPEFVGTHPGSFALEEVPRPALAPDLEAVTTAGAYLLRIRPPRAIDSNEFSFAVQKQGKAILNIPGSSVENYASGAKNISLEANLGGALKAHLGASTPDRISAHVTAEGGIHLDVGRDSAGNAITVTLRGGVKTIFEGSANGDDVATSTEVSGVKETNVRGAENKTIEGNKNTIVSGQYMIKSDRAVLNSHSGFTGNYGESNVTVNGASQWNYAKKVTTTVSQEGTEENIKQGDRKLKMDAGSDERELQAGNWKAKLTSGDFDVAVTTGAIKLETKSGQVTLSTSSGSMSIKSSGGNLDLQTSLSMSLQASVQMTLTAPMLMLGGSSASLGVCRGSPALPQGSPTLDPITGSPLQGSSSVFSN